MVRLLFFVLCASLASSAFPAAPPAPLATKAQIGAWEINYDTDACKLLAQFGEEPQPVYVALTQYQPSDRFDLIVYGAPFAFARRTVPVRIGFGLADPVAHTAWTGKAGNGLPVLMIQDLRLGGAAAPAAPRLSAADEARAAVLDLTVPGGKRMRLQTGSFAKPMQAMRACLDDLVKSWGYDPAEQAALTARPEPLTRPSSWLTNGDYPSGALLAGQNGLVQFRLDVADTGAVKACRVLFRTEPDSFGALTCKRLAQRARFRPARDRAGKPVASFYIDRARFVTPQ